MTTKDHLKDFVTFFVAMDPVGTIPIFLSQAKGRTPSQLRGVATRAVLIAAVVLCFFAVLGQILLSQLGVGLPAFRVAGGIILFRFAMSMIFSEPHEGRKHEGDVTDAAGDVAVFPLAIPAIAGPGTILASVVLTDNDKFSSGEQAVTCMVMLGVLVVQWLLLLAASPIQRLLGNSGSSVLSRVLGLILAALAVETIVEAGRAIILEMK
jgi:multiple antibiotic resistance protein